MATKQRILVTGATGRQGGAVARHLLAHDFPVRILTRDPSKPAARVLAQRGAEAVAGDLETPASLDAALADVYGVYAMQNYWEKGVGAEGEVRQGKNLADVVKRAGVRHYVQSSSADADQLPHIANVASKAEVVRHVQAIGLPYTILGLVLFMENFLDPKHGPLLLPFIAGVLEPSIRLHFIAVDDIGAIATGIFENPDRYLGRTVNVAGDLLTVAEMRAAYARATGKRAKGWKIPGFLGRHLSREMYDHLVWNNRPGWTHTLDESRRLHPGLTSFEAFVRKSRPERL